jgi:hypothetical protein
MSDNKKKIKYLTKIQKFAGQEVTLYSIDGATWSTRREELGEILERHERERVTFGGELKGQMGGGFKGGKPGRKPGQKQAGAEGAAPSDTPEEDGESPEPLKLDAEGLDEAADDAGVGEDLDEIVTDDEDEIAEEDDLAGDLADEDSELDEASAVKPKGRGRPPVEKAKASKPAPMKETVQKSEPKIKGKVPAPAKAEEKPVSQSKSSNKEAAKPSKKGPPSKPEPRGEKGKAAAGKPVKPVKAAKGPPPKPAAAAKKKNEVKAKTAAKKAKGKK